MKKLLTILLISLLLIPAGCGKKPPAPPKTENPHATAKDDTHKVVNQGDMTLSVSMVKYFEGEMIPAAEGKIVVGVGVAVTNNNKTATMKMDPQYFTLTGTDGITYQYNPEKTQITGKGALVPGTLEPDFRINGLILFEIPKDVKINTLHYKDESNHELDIKLSDWPSGV